MEIKFTKEQYENLMKLCYLGNWMANAIHVGNVEDPKIKKFDDIEQYIYSFAKEFGFGDLVEYDKKYKEYFPTREFDEDPELEEIRNNYEGEAFWDELHYQLSERDFLKFYDMDEITKMDIYERIKKEEPFREKWDKELEKHGIERLDVNEGN